MENHSKTTNQSKKELGQEPERPIYGYPLKFESRLDLMRKAVAIFATLESLKAGKTKIRKKLIDVLTFYALNGYSLETKRMIVETLEISTENLTQINAELTKSGYLVRDSRNYRKKYLNSDLKKLRDIFITDSPIACKRAIIIKFDE